MKKHDTRLNFKYYFPYFIRGIICFLILLAITLLVFFFELKAEKTFTSLLDGFLISLIVGLSTSLFCYLTYSGALNIFAYGFSSFGSIFSKNVQKRYKDLHEYNEAKKLERAGKTYYFLSYLMVSSFFLISLIVGYICFLNGITF